MYKRKVVGIFGSATFFFMATLALGQDTPIRETTGKRLVCSLRLGDFLVSPNLRQIIMRSGAGGTGVICWITPWYEGAKYNPDRYGPDSAIKGEWSKNGKYALVSGGGKQINHVLDGDSLKFKYSEDGSDFAIWGYESEKKQHYININGLDVASTAYSIDRFKLSPDGRHYAYWTMKTKKQWIFVFDGKEKGPFATPGDIVFGQDSNHIAWTTNDGKDAIIMVDGERRKTYEAKSGWIPGTVRFSPNGEHLAWTWARDSKAFVVIDDIEQNSYLGVDSHTLVFSPDGQHVCFFVNSYDTGKLKKGKAWLVLDGKDQKQYDMRDGFEYLVSPIFSPDSQSVVYLAKEGKDYFLVWNGNESKRYRGGIYNMIFSPDSSRIIYRYYDPQNSEFQAVLWTKDGERDLASEGVTYAVFDPISSEVISCIKKQNKEHWSRGGKDDPEFDMVLDPIFSPDGKHMAYAAYDETVTKPKKKNWTVVVDGQKGETVGWVVGPGLDDGSETFRQPLVCFDSNDSFHYLAWIEEGLYMVDEKIISKDPKK